MWEVFNPKDGEPIYIVRFRFLARIICRFNRRLDYAQQGEGWV